MSDNNTKDFELSDDSDGEYESNRRLERRLRSSQKRGGHTPVPNGNEENDGIKERQISFVAKTVKNVVCAITSLNYDDDRTSYTKKSDLNQIVSSPSPEKKEEPRLGSARKGGNIIASKLLHMKKRITRIYCYWGKNLSKRRFELWIVTPCIMALFIILYFNSSSSDNFMINNEDDGLQHSNAIGRSWIEHKLNHHKFEDYYLERYAMLADLYTPLKITDIPFLWSAPFGGTDVLEEMVMKCYGNDTITGPEGLTDISGILELRDITEARVAIKDIEDTATNPILISSFLPSTSSIFIPEKRGRVFTVLRDPIHRAVDQYYDEYRIAASQIAFTRDDDVASASLLSLEEYVLLSGSDGSSDGRYFVDNWLTRSLTDRLEPSSAGVDGTDNNDGELMWPDLGQEHLEYAKQILRQKCWVGLLEEMEDFVDWMEVYFQWDYQHERRIQDMATCRNSVMQEHFYRQTAMAHSNRYPIPGSDLHSIILEKNKWDMQLYWYARDVLYNEELGMINFIFSRQEQPLPQNVKENEQQNSDNNMKENEQQNSDNNKAKEDEQKISDNNNVNGNEQNNSDNRNVNGNEQNNSDNSNVNGNEQQNSDNRNVSGNEQNNSNNSNVNGSEQNNSDNRNVNGNEQNNSDNHNVNGNEQNNSDNSNVNRNEQNNPDNHNVNGNEQNNSDNHNVNGNEQNNSDNSKK